MSAAEIASFSIVPLGWWCFRQVARWARTRDRFTVSPEWHKDRLTEETKR